MVRLLHASKVHNRYLNTLLSRFTLSDYCLFAMGSSLRRKIIRYPNFVMDGKWQLPDDLSCFGNFVSSHFLKSASNVFLRNVYNTERKSKPVFCLAFCYDVFEVFQMSQASFVSFVE